MFHCHHCLHGFVRQDLLDVHLPFCSSSQGQRISFPEDDHRWLEIKDFGKQVKAPFCIYADFKSITQKTDSTQPNPDKSYTEKYQHHQLCRFSYVIKSVVDDYCMPPVVYRGPDAVDTFLDYLLGEEHVIQLIFDHEVPMIITPEEKAQLRYAIRCHICEEEFGADRVRDHCHPTGKYNECNLQYSYNKGPNAKARIPVILHNLRL